MGELFLILVSTSLVNNLVLDFMLGTNLLIAGSRKTDPAFDMGLLMLIVMPSVSIISYIIDRNLLQAMDIAYLQLIMMVLLIPMLVLITVNVIGRFFSAIVDRIQVLVPLIMVNCTILGVAMLGTGFSYGAGGAFFLGIGSALGFALVLISFSAIREKISVSDIPIPFRGVAIVLITLGLISMAFMGFNGISSIK